MRCSSEHQGGPCAGVGRPATVFAREEETFILSCKGCSSVSLWQLLLQLRQNSQLRALLRRQYLLCWTLFYTNVCRTESSRRRCCLLESSCGGNSFRLTCEQNPPLFPLPLCPILIAFSGIHSLFGKHATVFCTYSPSFANCISPLFPCHWLFLSFSTGDF